MNIKFSKFLHECYLFLISDPCLKVRCGAGRVCEVNEKGEGVCVCIPECPQETDARRKVSSSSKWLFIQLVCISKFYKKKHFFFIFTKFRRCWRVPNTKTEFIHFPYHHITKIMLIGTDIQQGIFHYTIIWRLIF